MKIIIDMNLTPHWVSVLEAAGHDAKHWMSIGSPHASDREILSWAKKNGSVVFTHDLDFGAILAATDAAAPSVIQVRTADPTPDHCSHMIIHTLAQHEQQLVEGALISVDENRSRVRILPLGRPS